MVESTDVLLEDRHGGVLVLSMNRPERLHALNRALNSALVSAVERANADPSVRVIIITGTGDRAFCAGADMKEASSRSGTPESSEDGPRGNASTSIANSPLVVIAAVNGFCYGGGARLAIQADLRLASENATFRIPGAEYGLVVAAATLPRLVGAAKAKELLFTTKRIDAAEALACGLVTAVYPQEELLPAALAMAQTIAGYSADAVRDAKRVIDAATLSDDAKALEDEVNKKLRGSPEQTERFADATRRITGS
jgi:enoyl-CoA hydratase/carnithine racemase